MKKILSLFNKRDIKCFLGMLIGTIIYCIGIVWILDLVSLYAGGVTGIAQIIETVAVKLGLENSAGIKSIVIIVLNAPLFIIGWGGVSKRFAILSLVSVLLQSLFILLLEKIPFNPLETLQQDVVTMSIVGGLVTGVGCGICLKYGTSTGGMDILSQFYSLKNNSSFAKFSFSVDFVIICLSAFVGSAVTAVYTIIRMIVSTLVLDKVHTSYKFMKLSIISDKYEEMREILITKFNHGVTVYNATGAFTEKTKYVFETVVSSYEVEEYKNTVKKIDPSCFITFTSIKGIDGFFNKNIIA